MKNGKNIRGALSYNEAKVRSGKAELILASRYGCAAGDLSFSQKLKRFTVLNDNCVTSSFNTVHISLNFSPTDTVDTEQMQLIARDYMQALGFEKQPYLVYRHNDTAHPHLHIVTTPVKANGRTINLHNLVQRKSEPTRKSIEETYQLVKAEGRNQFSQLGTIDANAVQYGKSQTKQAISKIVRTVADTWRFTSFEEYELMLKQFGVTADRGGPGTRIRKHGGLQYFIINEKREKISVGIKASSIYTAPTLKNLQKKFTDNAVKKLAASKYTASTVQFALSRSTSRNDFFYSLHDKQIRVMRTSDSYIFIDHRNKIVVSPAELGIHQNAIEALDKGETLQHSLNLSLLQKLLEPEYSGPDLAGAFLKKKRRKKR